MKILLISKGSIGQRHYLNLKKLVPRSIIKILRTKNKNNKSSNEVNEEQAKSFNADLILINSPASKHFYHYKKFYNQKKSFFIEKPIESSIKNINKSFLNKKNNFTMVGYVLRFDNILLKIKKLILEKKYGETKLVDIKVGQYLPDWRINKDYTKSVSAQKKLGGGALLELSHEIDYATWIFGFPKKIFGITKKISNLKIDVEDVATLIFEYPKKIIQISLDFLQQVPKMEIKIICERGTIYADLIKQKLTLFNKKSPNGKKIRFQKFKNSNEIYLYQMDFLLFKSFKNYQPKFNSTKKFNQFSTINSAYKVLKLIDKIKSSNKKNKKIKV